MINNKSQEQINLANNLKWLRMSHGLTKKEMAQIMGIGVGSLNKLEQGILPPRADVRILFRLREHFGIPVHTLFVEWVPKK